MKSLCQNTSIEYPPNVHIMSLSWIFKRKHTSFIDFLINHQSKTQDMFKNKSKSNAAATAEEAC